MKFATYKNGSRDGRLLVVSRDLTRAVDAAAVAPTMQQLIEDWAARAPRLQALSDRHLDLQPFSVTQVVRMADVPKRGPKLDAIGRKLEDLGLGLPTETPADRKTGGATTPGGRP